MLYFTSDLHLGHENAIEFKGRPFKNIDEMNDTLINNINERVGKDDELWILGDFSYHLNKEQVREMRNRINCKMVHLINGNHDKNYLGDHIFQSVLDYHMLKTDWGRFVLFHYPIVEWASAHYGTVHLHGHIHSTGEYNKENLKKFYKDRMPEGHSPADESLRLRIYDVGVDANNFYPVSIMEIVGLMGLEKIKE